ncbi:MAG TPA: hypothetical protein VHK26_01810 [Methyloceanibacter sp.]|jgi:hypothetical protein|nr:hypothetical protein [Methyloceanibacter sp.]
MRFFIGALALAVICVLLGTPAAFVLGWVPQSAPNRQTAKTDAKDAAEAGSKPASGTAVTVRPKGSLS